MKNTQKYGFIVLLFIASLVLNTGCGAAAKSNRRVQKQVCLDYFNFKEYSKIREIEKAKREKQLEKVNKQRRKNWGK